MRLLIEARIRGCVSHESSFHLSLIDLSRAALPHSLAVMRFCFFDLINDLNLLHLKNILQLEFHYLGGTMPADEVLSGALGRIPQGFILIKANGIRNQFGIVVCD